MADVSQHAQMATTLTYDQYHVEHVHLRASLVLTTHIATHVQ